MSAALRRRRRAIYCRQRLRLLLMHILHTVPSVLTVLPPLVVVVCPDEFDTNGFHHFWKSTDARIPKLVLCILLMELKCV